MALDVTIHPRNPKTQLKPKHWPCCTPTLRSPLPPSLSLPRQIEHEVMHQGRIHSLCSDACFLEWRNSRQLAMNCCEGCGLYCKSDSDVCQTLTVEKAQLNFCSPTCVSTYKQVRAPSDLYSGSLKN